MRMRTIVMNSTVAIVLLSSVACTGARSLGGEKTIKSTRSSDTTITLSSSTGELKSGENDLMLSFTDAAGKPVDVGAASLKFHMPAMAPMTEMNDVATLTTTDTRGKLHARVNIEVAGTWEAMISFQGPRGTEQATMSVNAK